MAHRSPMRTSGSGPRSSPGTMPAVSVTWEPIIVPPPMWIPRPPNTLPGRNPLKLSAPKEPKRALAAVPGVTVPARCAHAHNRLTRAERTHRRGERSATRSDMVVNRTGQVITAPGDATLESADFPWAQNGKQASREDDG